MSGAGGHDAAREIARGLSQIVGQALEPRAPLGTLDAARDLARLLSLRGLDHLLAALSPHAGGSWPSVLEPVVGQLRGAAAECGRVGDVEAFRRLDDELALMARVIERSPPAQEPPTHRPIIGTRAVPSGNSSAPVSLAHAMEGLPVQGGSDALLRTVRLRPPVAGALRAALDWLLGEGTPRLRLWLASDGSALEVTCDGIAFSGVHAASELLSSVGAHLGPTGHRPGAWLVRVPIHTERETFLMVEQGELGLAIPWHSVARVRLMPIETIDAMARRQGLAVLEPLAVAPRRAIEQPVVVVALGLKRACLVADRLVWRMPAQRAESPGTPPAAGIIQAVRSEDGDLYWVLDPAWLLRGIALPAVGEPPRGGRVPAESAPAPPTPASGPTAAPKPPIPFPYARSRAGQPAATETPSLGAQDVDALPEMDADAGAEETIDVGEPMAPADASAPSPADASAPSPADASASPPVDASAPSPVEASAPSPADPSAPPRPAPVPADPGLGAAPASPAPAAPTAPARRQALVAEDSITARIFLVRLLEQQGFGVLAVGSAGALRAQLARGPWALVCADLELPDAGGEGLLREVMRAAQATASPLVVLVRDAADEAVARAAGVAATLRKPFERESLERVLGRLVPGFSTGATRPAGRGPDPREWGAR
jgi:CheY-like chemotaxis protein